MAQYSDRDGGVGAPVGLTVFKTAGGSLGAVPGGFDSHTPLPRCCIGYCCAVIILMVLQILQDYASHFPLQNYGSPSISVREELFHGCFERTGQTESSEEAHPSQEWTKSLSLWCCKRVSCRDRRRKKKA
jgi:hypothetical protein